MKNDKMRRGRRLPVIFEELEPRLLLSADLPIDVTESLMEPEPVPVHTDTVSQLQTDSAPTPAQEDSPTPASTPPSSSTTTDPSSNTPTASPAEPAPSSSAASPASDTDATSQTETTEPADPAVSDTSQAASGSDATLATEPVSDPTTDSAPQESNPNGVDESATAELLSADALPPTDDETAAVSGDGAANSNSEDTVQQAELPLAFEANEGQTAEEVDFLARGSGYTVYLTEGDAVLALEGDDTTHVVRLNVTGTPDTVAGDDLLESRSNYLIGSDPQDWHTDVANYAAVEYQGVQDGVDLRYYGNERQLEYDFIVAAGADPNAIGLNFEGVHDLSITDSGELSLVLNEAGDEVRFHAPVSYQETADGAREIIASQYVIDDQGKVGFGLDDYDVERALIIDPVLDWGTYLGGTGTDRAYAIAVDAAGNSYITGATASANFPTTVGAYDTTKSGGNDVFVTKLSADGSSLIYSTFIGGSSNDQGNDIVINAAGEAFITGETNSNNFATTGGVWDDKFDGASDAFITKLNAAGNALVYSTYVGGNENDRARGITIDAAGNAYITGESDKEEGFPRNGSAYQDKPTDALDAFVVKMNPTGTNYVYGTFLGGDNNDGGNDIAIDAAGNAYITGYTWSNNFPTAGGPYDSTYNGGQDAFFAKFNTNGTALPYSTYLGGGGSDEGHGIVLDAAENIYMVGDTYSNTFPTSAGAYDQTHNGGMDAFVTSFDAGLTLAFSTFFGGAGNDSGKDITLNSLGEIHIVGQAASGNLPVTGNAYQSTLEGASDAYLARFDSTATSLVYATYLGGAGNESGEGITVDGADNMYIAGYTSSSDFDTTTGAYDEVANGVDDAFVVKFDENSPPAINNAATSVNEDAINGTSVYNVNDVNTGNDTDEDGDAISYSITAGNTDGIFTINSSTGEITVLDNTNLDFETTNQYVLTVEATDGSLIDPADITIDVNDVNETPVINNATTSVNEDAVNGTSVYNVNDVNSGNDTDEDGDAITYSITAGNSNGIFTINAGTGEITVLDNTNLDFETTNQYVLTVEATDGSLIDPADITIDVNDVNETPVINNATTNVNEDAVNGTSVYNVNDVNSGNDTDEDGDAITYSITAGNTDGIFTINSSTGEITVLDNTNLDFETTNQYVLTVEATDGSLIDPADITIDVNDVNDDPIITSDGGGATALLSTTENMSTVTSVSAIDEDGDPVTYSITGGADSGEFGINSTTGALSFVTAPDFENPTDTGLDNVYEVEVAASDGIGGQDTQLISVAVNDLPVYTFDDFTPNNFNGNDGNKSWSGGWIEIDTTGPGFNSGKVVVSGNELSLNGTPDSPDGPSAAREVDLTGVSIATLTFDYRTDVGVEATEDSAIVEVSNNGGGTWNTLETFDYIAGAASGYRAYDISAYVSLNTQVRFRVDANYGGPSEFFFVDNVQVEHDNSGNDPPVIISDGGGATASVSTDEDTTAITTVVATDFDSGDILTYSITGGSDQAQFNINGSSGVLTFVSAPDFENPSDFGTDNVYDVQVTVDDGNGGNDSQLISVTVNDINETPVINNATTSVNEDAINGTSVYNVNDVNSGNDTDIDGDALTYSITAGNTDGIFTINAGTGEITVLDNTNLDFETTNQYVLTVEATDGSFVDPADITIDVNDVNETPLINNATSNVNEDAINGTSVYNVNDVNTGSDTDEDGDAITYSITAGNPDGIFTINAGTGEITVLDNTNLDFETTNQYVLTVEATDGSLIDPADITIDINDINETPVINNATTSVNEDAVNGTSVYNVNDVNTGNDTDEDGDAISYSITAGNTDGIFTINAGTGEITVLDNTNLDFETTNQYVLTVEATDGSLIDPADITIDINDVNETPVINNATTSVNEDAVNGTSVYNVNDVNTGNDTDQDGDALTYSITAGNTDGIFTINAGTGEITVLDNTNLDFETTNQYVLTVEATDGSLIDPADITIDVNDINETPVINNATTSVNEDATNGTSVYNVNDVNSGNDTDEDGDAITYSITAGNSDGIFTINAATGEITVLDNTNLDFETTNQYVLTVEATDGSLIDPADITIDVNDVNETPVINNATTSVNEDATNGTSVYNVNDVNSGNDTDEDGDAITYSITAGNSDGIFTINAATGEITVLDNTNLNFETTNQYVLTVEATDGSLIDPADITIDVNDVNETPVINNATTSVNEDAVNGTSVYNVNDVNSGNDTDEDGDAITYSITAGNTDGIFTINSSTGEITVLDNTNLNFETTNQYVLTVEATDGSLIDPADITIDVNDVNETPVIDNATSNVNEDAVNGTSVYNVNDANTGNDTDEDGDAITYSITAGNTDGIFTINSSTGEITVLDNTNLNFETTNQYVLTVEATDGSLIDPADITIDVNDVNETPVIDNATSNVNEDAVNGTSVYNVNDVNSGNDTDEDGDAITYSITAGNTNGIFTINSSTGEITVLDNTNLDFETTNQYVLTVEATDGSLIDPADITIDVNDINETPVINNATTSVNEDAVNGTSVYNVNDVNSGNDTDEDGDAITYSITAGNTDGIFTINSSTGEITVLDNTNLDFETTNQYVLTVEATDGSLIDPADITIDVNDVNETPVINNATTSVNEDATNGTSVYNVNDVNSGNDTDEDGDAITYSITAGNSDGIFTINAATGEITVLDNTNLNFETTNQYVLTVEATDGSLIDPADITIDVNDVNETPVIDNATTSVNEDATNGTSVYNVNDANSGLDSDEDGDAITYSITAGNTDGIFTINAATGEITVLDNTNLDFETTNQYVLTVEATDGSLIDPADITIDVNDVNETPVIDNATTSVNEDAVNGTSVYNVNDVNTGNDTDIDGDAITYSITAGNTDGIFTINSSTGEITVLDNTNLNFETTNQYVLTVEATDGSFIDPADITIDVNDIDEAPTTSGITDVTEDEDSAPNVIDLFAAFDDQEDPDNALSYSIVTNNNAALFDSTVIDGGAGTLTLDYFADANGSADLTVRATDTGSQFVDTTFTVNLNAVNDAPENGVPGSQTTDEDTSLTFSAVNGNLIAVSDVDAGTNTIEITLNATDGTVSLAGSGGLTFLTGTGTGDTAMRFTGTVSDINNAFDGMTFQPSTGFSGSASLQMITDDLGNTGASGALNDLDTIAIDVVAAPPLPPLDEAIVDDPPDPGGIGSSDPIPPVEPPDEITPDPVVTIDPLVLIDPNDPVITENTPSDVRNPSAGPGAETFTIATTTDTTPGSPFPSSINIPSLFNELLNTITPNANAAMQPSSDNDGPAAGQVKTITQMALVNPTLPPLHLSTALWELLDTMKQEINDNDGMFTKHGAVVATALGVTLTLSAGYVTWLLRFGYLAASLLSLSPLLAQFDPLPILAKRGRDKDAEPKQSAQTADNVDDTPDLLSVASGF